VSALAYANNIFALYAYYNTKVDISGNGNIIAAQGTGGNAKATSNGGSVTARAYADNIFALYANYNTTRVDITGNCNTFAAKARGGLANGTQGDGKAWGIYANDSIINFASTAKGTKIIADGDTNSYGIYANSAAHLQIDGADVADLNNLANLIDFPTHGNGGYEIQWVGHGTINWPL
jgi:hypothetical protein